jgi:hypothetical protein
MKHRLSASRIKLGRRCLWWARPDVEVPPAEETRPAAVGTAFHDVAESEAEELDEDLVDERFARLVAGVELDKAAEGLSTHERRHLEALVTSWREWWAQMILTGAETEQPIQLFVSGAAERLPKGEHRDYSAADDAAIPGTADVVAVWASNDGSSAHFVGDYKTGFGPHRLDDHIDQLTHLGTAFARKEGAESVRVGVIHVRPDGVELDSRVLDGFDMALHVTEMAQLLEELPTAEPRPGLHCEEMYCPARAVCPATRALLVDAKLALEPRRRLPLVGDVEENDQALAILVAAPLIESWLADRVKAARAFADANGGVRAPDGRIYRSRPQTRETPRLDVDGAREAMRRVLGSDADSAIKTKVSTSFEAMRDVVRARRAAGEKIPIEDTIKHTREALREVGALKISEFDTYDWADESPKLKKGKRS